ncbi:MAG: UDP-N-acetylmuramate--L-alanine ligase [Actinomycetota bacterium]|nr:MAG: UDP-N-acetylmuramate--L-alanine ligase [Actinomycetota bacterium]
MSTASAAQPLAGPVHVVGIGGAGMSGIARILLARGVTVSGSDAKDSRRLSALRALGATVHVGHAAGHVAGAAVVVVSTAIKESNVELLEARRRGVPVLSRAAALAAIMAGQRGVAVAGTHGKTTTTSMLTVALQHCGADPSFAIGSELNESGSNAHLGTGELFVVEADESDGSFLHLDCVAGIVTNVEADHLDHWGTLTAIEAAFESFAARIGGRDGFLVCCADDIGAAKLAAAARVQGIDVRTYGRSPAADFVVHPLPAESGTPRFDVSHRGVRLGTTTLAVPGAHNVLNATAAWATGIGLGYSAGDLRVGLESFSGTRRRFEFRGQADGVRVFDDYAHHPTEIAATLTAARDVAGGGRLVVAFQAHHYYRTALFVKEFGAALGLADEVVVLEVFAPGEAPIPGASGQLMAAAVPLPEANVVFEPSWSAVASRLADRARPGDLVMTLGAGDISMIGPEVLELLRRRASAAAGPRAGR